MITDSEKQQYLHRSYSAVDGLWFMKIEEKFGFDNALDIDSAVWEVMPKIQARFLKEKLNEYKGLNSLLSCFSIKLELDGFTFKAEKISVGSIRFTITKCPWLEIMARSNRINLAGKIGEKICKVEYDGWAKEFGENISFNLIEKACNGSSECTFSFELK